MYTAGVFVIVQLAGISKSVYSGCNCTVTVQLADIFKSVYSGYIYDFTDGRTF